MPKREQPVHSSNDDRDGAAVGAPRGAGHVRRPLRAEEGDHTCDLVGLSEPAERSTGTDGGEHLVPGLPASLRLLIGEPAGAEPGIGRGRARRDGVAPDPVAGVQVCDQPRQRDQAALVTV